MKKFHSIAVAIAALSIASTASAGVYDSTNAPGNQDWANLMAETFEVNANNLVVTQLGAFDYDKNGITSNIYVALMDVTTSTIVAASSSFINAAANGTQWVYQDLAGPVALTLGHTYAIGAFGYNNVDQNYNSYGAASDITFNTLGGALTSVGAYYTNAQSFSFSGINEAPSTRYGAATLTATAVPEPETYAMLLAGLGVMGFLTRRRKG